MEEMFNLHAVELGWPVPIPSGHRFDDGEAGLMDSALDAAVMAQGDFTGDKLLEVLEMAVTVAREVLQLCSHAVIGWLDAPSGLFGFGSFRVAPI